MTTLTQHTRSAINTIEQLATQACAGKTQTCAQHLLQTAGVLTEANNVRSHNSIATQSTQLIMAARTLSEKRPEYDAVAAHLLLNKLMVEVTQSLSSRNLSLSSNSNSDNPARSYQQGFLSYIYKGIKRGLINPEVIAYDLPLLASKITPHLDSNLTYVELQGLAGQLLMRHEGKCFELPQYAFMRIAIALAIRENKDEVRVVEMYRLLSLRSYSRISAKTFYQGTLFGGTPYKNESYPNPNYKALNHKQAPTIINKGSHLRLVN